MKKRTEKLLALATLLAMGTTALASCGNKAASGESASGEAKSEGKVALSMAIWDEKQRAMTESLVEAYTKTHPNVSIEVQLTPIRAENTGPSWRLLPQVERLLMYSG